MKFLLKTFCIVALLLTFSANIVKAETLQGPVMGGISSGYGYRTDPFTGKNAFHHGIDLAAPYGAPIYAMQDGVVVKSRNMGGYGLCVVIDHFYSDIPQIPRIQTKYGHNSINFVKEGEYVKRGQVIALIGSSGRSTGPHLHFEVIYQGRSVDPIDYLTKLPSYLDYVAKIRTQKEYAYKKNYGTGMGGY